jgi:hypothetical protein
VNESPVVIPQPLTGTEIKRGIAVRMTRELPEDVLEPLKDRIIEGLGKTCSLLGHTAYAKFNAKWTLVWWMEDGAIHADWWVKYSLDDFGRITYGGIGDRSESIPMDATKSFGGTIDEVPPDRFRRETDQPIPKPTELKKPDPQQTTFSQSMRGQGKRRDV